MLSTYVRSQRPLLRSKITLMKMIYDVPRSLSIRQISLYLDEDPTRSIDDVGMAGRLDNGMEVKESKVKAPTLKQIDYGLSRATIYLPTGC